MHRHNPENKQRPLTAGSPTSVAGQLLVKLARLGAGDEGSPFGGGEDKYGTRGVLGVAHGDGLVEVGDHNALPLTVAAGRLAPHRPGQLWRSHVSAPLPLCSLILSGLRPYAQ